MSDKRNEISQKPSDQIFVIKAGRIRRKSGHSSGLLKRRDNLRFSPVTSTVKFLVI